MRKVTLNEIRIDGGTQGRKVIDQTTVYSYLESMKEGDVFPMMFTVFDGATHWLVDGFHRYHAYKILGIKEIEIVYKPGTQQEAQVLSFGMNGKHGKPRTNEDKRNVVLEALAHPLTKDKNDNELAKICDVSRPFIATMRKPEAKKKQLASKAKYNAKKKEGLESETITSDENSAPVVSITDVDFEKTIKIFDINDVGPDEQELKALELSHQADIETMHKLLEADEPLKVAHAEIERLTLRNSQLEIRFRGLMGERNECVKMIKQLQKELEKAKSKK